MSDGHGSVMDIVYHGLKRKFNGIRLVIVTKDFCGKLVMLHKGFLGVKVDGMRTGEGVADFFSGVWYIFFSLDFLPCVAL